MLTFLFLVFGWSAGFQTKTYIDLRTRTFAATEPMLSYWLHAQRLTLIQAVGYLIVAILIALQR